MSDRVADFADTYSKMSDEQLSRIRSDEKSLVDDARVALQSEVQRRKLASPADEGIESGSQIASLWERQLAPVGVGGWLLFWCFVQVFAGSLYALYVLLNAYLELKRLAATFGTNHVVMMFVVMLYCVLFSIEVFSIVVGVCVYLVRPYALRLLFIYFLICAAIEGCLLVLFFSVNGESQDKTFGYLFWGGIMLVVWFVYFKRSKRVRATFGRNL
jgi:uncharacterized membrane protein YdbT with pleckstrin-like domain